jgi:hypothetical protein
MHMKLSITLFVLIRVVLSGLSPQEVIAQPFTQRYDALGKMLVIQSSFSIFPHAKRDTGHVYGEKNFPAELHYRDSSVAIFVPKGFHPEKTVDFVFYFHGWMNNIDSAFAKYRIIEQFSESNKNAILVHPEGPRNSPDSFGGKLEETNTFRNLVGDVLLKLRTEKIVRANAIPGKIILAGHSGAYRVISFILLRGGLTGQISEVYLFDALYGEMEKFAYWIDHYRGKFIDIHTAKGGTRQESMNLMDDLTAWNIPFFAAKETTLTSADLRTHRLVFIDSDLSHNGVIFERNQFREYLRTSGLKDRP